MFQETVTVPTVAKHAAKFKIVLGRKMGEHVWMPGTTVYLCSVSIKKNEDPIHLLSRGEEGTWCGNADQHEDTAASQDASMVSYKAAW